MNIEYISDSEEQQPEVAWVPLEPSETMTIVVINPIKPKVDESLHQILTYPPIEKHSIKKIVSICNDIDLIDAKLQSN